MDRYRPRLSRAAGVVHRGDWTVKLIGITADDELPTEAEVAVAIRSADRELPEPAITEHRQGHAFLIVHRGTEALWAVLGWWELDILHHRLYRADLGTVEFEPVEPGGPTACVWELLAVDHERRAWVEHVLSRPEAPDFEGYVADTFSA